MRRYFDPACKYVTFYGHKIELRRIMHDPIAKTGAWVKQMLKGHLNYFAVSGNHPSLWWFTAYSRRGLPTMA
jgi:hypothetical protein